MPRAVSPGYIREVIPLHSTDAAQFTGTGAVNVATSVKPGFRCYLERLAFTNLTAGAGAGATQTFRLRKGNATGTIILTLTVIVTDVDNVGEGGYTSPILSNYEAGYLGDTDTFSITRDAGGTAYTTAPIGTWHVTVAQQPQARR